jgi:hypothetical protein
MVNDFNLETELTVPRLGLARSRSTEPEYISSRAPTVRPRLESSFSVAGVNNFYGGFWVTGSAPDQPQDALC